jgi:AraC family transcriptional regulator of adaptative response / DNA-3-methyladenine glycosylase II
MRALTDEEGRRPTPAELLARSQAWRPWRAYAAQHLWAADAVAPQAKTSERKKTDARPRSAQQAA